MSEIIDLSILTQEPLVLKFSEENKFTIPPEPKVELVLKIYDFQEKMPKIKDHKKQFDMFVEMVLTILSQDSSKKIDTDFVIKNLSLQQMQKVVEIYSNKILANQNNPN
ncbi:hypothetical protein V7266_12340 [Neobacillus drentensis]|uniref:hypothetical protein n=1 Tax=Neobacillus drentensis TaxID=220684 RepID=UPI002FFFA74F